MSRPSLLDGQAAQQHCDTQSSDTRNDSEARELTPELTTTATGFKTRLNDDSTVISEYSQSLIDPVSKVNESESQLRRERDAALITVGEQKTKLNDLYVKIGRLWEKNDALKENITALKDQEDKNEELCETCKAKETEIAELQEQLGPAGARAKNDPDEDIALAGLRIVYFRAEEDLRIKGSEHAAEIAKIREEHETIITQLQLGLRDARSATKKEHAERLHTQEQLSNTTKELSDTQKQLSDSEKQYRILYDIIPKPGGGKMVESYPLIQPRLSQSREMDSSSSSVTPISRLERTSRSHGSHGQGHEVHPSPSHTSNGSGFSLDQDTLNEFGIAPTSTIDKRSHELDQDQSSTQRSNKRKKDVLSSQRMPPIFSADDITWLFCVLGAGGISYHKLHELSPGAQEKVIESFQSYFSAKNDAQYDATQAIHHNTYANMVRVSSRPANEKKDAVCRIS